MLNGEVTCRADDKDRWHGVSNVHRQLGSTLTIIISSCPRGVMCDSNIGFRTYMVTVFIELFHDLFDPLVDAEK